MSGHDDETKDDTVTTVRYAAFSSEVDMRRVVLDYNEVVRVRRQLVAEQRVKRGGNALPMSRFEIIRVLQPYISQRVGEQLKAVLPLAAYLILFQIFLLNRSVEDPWVIGAGLAAVLIGLMLFMEGLKLGLMPFGRMIGATLPKKATLPVMLTVILILGVGVTFAEPAIGALQAAGSLVDPAKAPYLYVLLTEWSGMLVLCVGTGVGVAAMLGTVRFLRGWSLKPLIYMVLTPILGLTAWMSFDPQLRNVVGMAWDCGAVTTGPVTVPLVLSLGLGIAHAAGKEGSSCSSLSGFGIVTMASLFPILAVMGLTLYVASQVDVTQVVALSKATAVVEPQWYQGTPFAEIISGVRAVVPLVLFLLLVLLVVLRDRLPHPAQTSYGVFLAVLGMVVFNIGLSYGLAKLGGQAGSLVPGAFTEIAAIEESPLYSWAIGMVVVAVFAWALGFGATVAEPALNALGLTVETLTNGAFRKQTMIYAVSVGVGTGIVIGVMRIIYDLPLYALLLPLYGLALVLTVLSKEEFVNIAWDSAGVTTGPVTVPLVLAMGLGLGGAMSAVEGFGILAMASVGPIISVLSMGLFIRYRERLAERTTRGISVHETAAAA